MFIQVGRNRSVGYEQNAPHECWPWVASRIAQGYGQCFNRRTRKVDKAHRVVFELLTGQVLPPKASGLELHHECHHRWCVNPAHLRLITVAENRANRRKHVYPVPEHGTIARYGGKHRCHCQACRTAWADYLRNRRRWLRFRQVITKTGPVLPTH